MLSALGIGLALPLLAGCSNGEATIGGPEHSIVIGHEDQTAHFNHETYLRFKEQVEERSDGRIGVKVVPNELFGDMTSLVTSVQLNSIQMTSPTAGVLGQFSKDQNVWDMPYLFDDVEHAHRVLDGEFGQELLEGLEEVDLIGFGYWENGVRHLSTKGIEVDGPDDLDRVKLRVQPNPLQLTAWGATSANPTPMAYGEVYTGLQQGTIDAQENPLSVIVDARFYEVQDRVTLTGHVYSAIPLVMSKTFYDSLPVDLQEIVTEAALDSIEFNRELAAEAEAESASVIEEAGVEIDEISDEGRDEFRESMQGAALPQLRDLVGDDVVDHLETAIEEERR
ncbi:TRAP transporter substrate-binding protein [Kocuria nitroreducens]|uniref:TRAP transporter substrate-binding protein n=1 Tax=Kocuria nitroreducens TaxID=3058914 RepID=UPI0036DE0ED7